MNICVCGYYGMGNFGDELFLKTFKQIFKEDNLFQWTPYLDTSKIDAVIIGGGDLIEPYSFNEGYFPPQLVNHPTWLYGVGIVDYYPRETWPQEEINKNSQRISKAVKTYFRDENSATIAKEFNFNNNIDVVPDIVFAYEEPKYPISRFSNKETIGICIYVYDDFPLQKMLNIFADLASKGYHLVIIPVVNKNNAYSDIDKCKDLENMIIKAFPLASITVLFPHYDLEMLYSYIQALDYLITFKLHPIIAALRSSIPAFAFNKLPKVSGLYNSLGLDYYINNFDLPLEEIKLKITNFLADGKGEFTQLGSKITDLSNESHKKLNLLKNEIHDYNS